MNGSTTQPLLPLTKGIEPRDCHRPNIRKDFDVIPPTVGPIVGFTTSQHARIFVRGELDKNNAVFAGIRHRKAGDSQWSAGVFSRLSPEFDMSDTLVLNTLHSDTRYEYQAGWFATANPGHTTETVKQIPLQWPATVYSFKTDSAARNRTRRYVVGSCRYLRLTAGIPSAPHLGDEIFGNIHALTRQQSIDAVVMAGDQVYVDDLNIVAPDRDYSSITRKYRAAFTQPHIRKLMAGTATYMILDDHEIEDNWPANRDTGDKTLYNNAMRAYEAYQCSHGPAHDLLPDGRINRNLSRYWYRFANADIDWFVMDCRTERTLTGRDKRMIGVTQEQALLKWLINSNARVKFIVSSVMLMPDQRRDNDGWKAFAAQRNRILETIRSNAIKNVVFVSGDIHGSLCCHLTHDKSPDFIVHSVVSSPLCNTRLLPYANVRDLLVNAPLTSVGTGTYSLKLNSRVVSEDNFVCLSISGQQLKVDFHNKKGRIIESATVELK